MDMAATREAWAGFQIVLVAYAHVLQRYIAYADALQRGAPRT